MAFQIGGTLIEGDEPVSLLAYGREGSGKTTGALSVTKSTPPGKRILVINAEGGLKRRPLKANGVNLDIVDHWPENVKDLTYDNLMSQVIEPLRENPGTYYAVVLDSLTEIARRLLDDVVAKAVVKATTKGQYRDPLAVELQDHGVSSSMMRNITRAFRDLRIHVIATALERRDIDQNSGAVSYGPAMGPAVGVDVMGQVDIVGWFYVEEHNGERFHLARFTDHSNHRAKDRLGALPSPMITPTFDRILDYVEDRLSREIDPERARIRAAIAAETSDGAPETPQADATAETPPSTPEAEETPTGGSDEGAGDTTPARTRGKAKTDQVEPTH